MRTPFGTPSGKAPVKLNDGKVTDYDLGWSVFEYNGRKVVGHGGGDKTGFSASWTRR
jgi:hypothetical protein